MAKIATVTSTKRFKLKTTEKLSKVHRSMLNTHFKAKKITSGSTNDGEFLYFDIKEKVEDKLVKHCDKIGLTLTPIED